MVDEQTQHDRDHLRFNGESQSLEISMSGQNQAPTLTSHQYLLFGKVTVKVKASKGPGLVTTVVLKSDSGDEIDWVHCFYSFPLEIVVMTRRLVLIGK